MGQTEKEIAEKVALRASELLDDSDQQPRAPELNDYFIKDCLDSNERGDGVLYSTLNNGKCLYNTTPKDGEWYFWTRVVWERDHFRRSQNAVEACALVYKDQADKHAQIIKAEHIDKKHTESWRIQLRQKYEKRVDRLRSSSGATKAMDWAAVVDPTMACQSSDFDTEPMLLPVKNGVVDLKTGALTTGDPADMLSRSIDVEYDQYADYSMWQEIIEEISGSPEVASFIKRSLGYAVTGLSVEQYIWVFVGPGRNGKGILFNMLSEVMGPYYHEINRGMILEQRNEPSPSAASEHKYSLLGKRIIVGSETNKNQRIDAGAVKALTGEDKITCRPNFQAEISFDPSHTLFLHTNHIPIGLTKDFALLQRLLRIEFPYMYVDDIEAEKKKMPGKAAMFKQKDPGLKDKLRKIKPGILRWLIEGCLEWQQQGLSPPPSILDGISALAKEEDFIGQFIDDCLVLHDPDPGGPVTRISCTEMYGAFRWWWSQNMDSQVKRVPAMKTINAEIRSRGYSVEKVGGKTWIYNYAINIEIADDVMNFLQNQ